MSEELPYQIHTKSQRIKRRRQTLKSAQVCDHVTCTNTEEMGVRSNFRYVACSVALRVISSDSVQPNARASEGNLLGKLLSRGRKNRAWHAPLQSFGLLFF